MIERVLKIISYLTGKPKKRERVKVRCTSRSKPLRKKKQDVILSNRITWPDEGKLLEITTPTQTFKGTFVFGDYLIWRHMGGAFSHVATGDSWKYITEEVPKPKSILELKPKPVSKIRTKFTYDTDAQLLLKDIVHVVKELEHNPNYRFADKLAQIVNWYEEYIMDEGYRGTGRTTQMLRQAEYSASLGKEVWIVFPTRIMYSHLKDIVKNPNIKMTTYNCTDFCKQTLRPIGVSQDAQVFIDPYLFQYLQVRYPKPEKSPEVQRPEKCISRVTGIIWE